jgi:hypothetical protein
MYWQQMRIVRERPDLVAELRVPPRRVRRVTRREAARLIDLARGAMATRSRDLDAFAYGDPRDVRIVEDTRGLAFALIGMIAERRKPDVEVYGAVTLRNGVPVGYMDLALAGKEVEISFNTFSTYRDGEAARIFARTLAMARRVFGSRVFRIGPYALGDGNPEAIESGAWWFYYKLGLRPRAAAARRRARQELSRWRADRSYRSSRKALQELAHWPLYYRYH